MAWLETSSVQNPAELTTITFWSVAALWSMRSNPWPELTITLAVSISRITSLGIGTPWLMIASAPLTASMVSPSLLQTWTSIS